MKKILIWTVFLLFILDIIIIGSLLVRRAVYAAYPLGYSELVDKYCNEFSVPRSLAYATLKVESGFSPDAVSAAGAKGLMQLMPSTFEEMSGLCGDFSDAREIFSPELNVKYGILYLSQLYVRFGRWDFAILAYNAGPNRVEQWISPQNLDSDGSLLNIPYTETREYLKKVSRAAQKYSNLYDMEDI